MTEKFSKCITDLAITDLLVYGLKQHGLKRRDIKVVRKLDLLRLLYEKEPTLLDDESRIFYFEKTGTVVKYLPDTCNSKLC